MWLNGPLGTIEADMQAVFGILQANSYYHHT